MKIIIKIISGIIIFLVISGIINSIKNNIPKGVQNSNIENNQMGLSLEKKPIQPTVSSEPTKADLILRDIKYGSDARNTMNVFIPKGSKNDTPFILFLHGGAWVSGDKNDIALVQLALGMEGVASAAMNYRYASDRVHYQELMSDVNSAVRYIVGHGNDWNIDTNKITIGGISAGAHMALLYAYHYDQEDSIRSVISLAGPTDLTNVDFLNGAILLKLINGANNMVGAKYEFGKPVPVQFKTASPVQYVKNIPTLIIHGTADIVVPYTQAELLNTTLQRKNYIHELMTIDGANHDLGLSNQVTAKKITDQVVNWVKKY
mgnify:CR=1 FL=1